MIPESKIAEWENRQRNHIFRTSANKVLKLVEEIIATIRADNISQAQTLISKKK